MLVIAAGEDINPLIKSSHVFLPQLLPQRLSIGGIPNTFEKEYFQFSLDEFKGITHESEHTVKAHNLKGQLPEGSMESLATTIRFLTLNCRTLSSELQQAALSRLLRYLCVPFAALQEIRMRDPPVISIKNYTIYCGDADENKSYNCTAETSANNWAVQCQNRDSGTTIYAETRYIFQGTTAAKDTITRTAINSWRDEVNTGSLPPAGTKPQNIYQTNLGIKNFAKMVWDTETGVGCSINRCSSFTNVVCHFTPRGDVAGTPIYKTAVCLPSDMNLVLSSGIGGTETELRVKVKDFHLTELGKKQSHPGPPQDSTQAVLPGYWFLSASSGMMLDEFIDAHLSPVHEPLWGQRLLSATLWTVSLANMSVSGSQLRRSDFH
ncbi:hypothetical protein RB195_007229 [Necator americanus]|uniref:SCP domain-containing protein n=1 Tax=Necator americanus TaxID=51031 RepID=A0ABR1BWD2_NECAM